MQNGIVKFQSGESQELLIFQRAVGAGACERASTCVNASEACHRSVFAETMVCAPEKRWMYCYAYKKKLGLVFDRELGVYILPEWRDELLRRARE